MIDKNEFIKKLSKLIENAQEFMSYDDIEKELVSYLDSKTIVKNNKITI